MEFLTTSEAAALKGCSQQYFRKVIGAGNIKANCSIDNKNRKKYLIPLTELPHPLQIKYYKQKYGSAPPELCKTAKPPPTPPPPKPLEQFTEAQRVEIDLWTSILEDWNAARSVSAAGQSKAEADAAFIESCRTEHPGLTVSVDILYRKQRALKSNDLDGLVDKRGAWKKGTSRIHPQVWRVFLSYYLDKAQFPVSSCVKYTRDWLEEKGEHELLATIPNDPTASGFRRRIESDIPPAVKEYERKGQKALHDRYLPYILRAYDGMKSNDWWVADNHTLDFMTLGENAKPHRLYLTAYIDARSTAFMGWFVTQNPCGDATLVALRNSIKKNGIPVNLLVDNGSEFLVHDIGGRGHRERKSQEGVYEPPGVFRRLGINMVNAIPGNPEAKPIERSFVNVKNEFSRTITSFCGGNILERPEGHAKLLKSGKLPTDEEIIRSLDEFIEGYYNHQPYNGAVKADHGKTRIQVYLESREEMRVPKSPEDLNLMMMRSSRPKKVGRRGVRLTIAGCPIDYWTESFLEQWQDKRVYYRYDPEDLSSVRVYDLEDKYIDTIPADKEAAMLYGAASEQIKAGMSKINRYNKRVKEWAKDKVLSREDKISAFMLMRISAAKNLDNPPDYMEQEPKIIRLVGADEEQYAASMAVGESMPLDAMIENIRRLQREEDEYDE